MRKILKNLLLLAFLSVLGGCSSENSACRSELTCWMNNNGKIKVLSSIAMINDLVQEIGHERVDALSLVKGELDPHSYQLVKGDDEKLAYADLIFYNGLGLEHGPSLQRYLTGNPKAISLGDKLYLKNPSQILFYNGQVDPHIWMDISLWAQTVPFIVEALSAKDPEHAAEFEANAQELIQKMLLTHDQVRKITFAIPKGKRYLVTSHDAFNYFTRAYLSEDDEQALSAWHSRFAAPEGLAPESQISSLEIQLIIEHLKKYQIHVLFPETNISKDSIRKIIIAGQENGLDLHIAPDALYADSMGPPGSNGDTYLKMIHYDAQTIFHNIMDKHD